MSAMTKTPPSHAGKLHVESIQTVTPAKLTELGTTRPVNHPGPPSAWFLQTHLRVVLYYKPTFEGESGYALTGWLKGSLNLALVEDPLLAGRLRHKEGCEDEWEITYNDSGVRLVEARAEVAMAEFVGSKGREEKEARLVYWKDIDDQNPQFSALFYVQVTRFEDGGYSIGLSWSPLLADLIHMTNFLKTWSQIQKNSLQKKDEIPKTSLFHLPIMRTGHSTHLSSTPLDTTPPTPHHHTTLLRLVASSGGTHQKADRLRGFHVIARGRAGEVEVTGPDGPPGAEMGLSGPVEEVNWADFGAREVALGGGSEPVLSSYYVTLGGNEGLVMVMPGGGGGGGGGGGEEGVIMSVTVPMKKI
ncbi:hypothetical protein QJS10_CPA08g01726 [Acorus calamus]|uniref:Uncharacterized protein n=1 Tax=Acorus calamus TaxID=4465 RepID=A0AAV9EBU1_ACOCL|nr:hypothetical protein QJS10_CPA08g01726 [Acorus calamus]